MRQPDPPRRTEAAIFLITRLVLVTAMWAVCALVSSPWSWLILGSLLVYVIAMIGAMSWQARSLRPAPCTVCGRKVLAVPVPGGQMPQDRRLWSLLPPRPIPLDWVCQDDFVTYLRMRALTDEAAGPAA